MKKKSQISLLMLGLFITLAMVVGISYAVWQMTLQQTEQNVITTGCFSITFESINEAIHLDKAYPISLMDGINSTPYKFKIKNNCNSYANYNIAIEVTNASTLDSKYIRGWLKLGEVMDFNYLKIIDANPKGTPTLENTKEAYILESSYLYGNEEKEYEFRLWMDERTPAIPEVMNQLWEGKITVTASYTEEVPIMPGTLRVISKTNKKGMWEYRGSINKIIIQNELKEIEGSIKTSDESALQDGSVMSYVVPNEDGTTYTAYLQSDKKLRLNPNSSYLFYNFFKVTEIEGMEYVDTSKVTNMNSMFTYMSKLTSLDVSHFDTSNVTDMGGMFASMFEVTSLDVSHFDTSNVTDMGGMFASSGLTSLDVSGFDTSNVTDMGGMFQNISGLTSLDLSHFDTSNVTDMGWMFRQSCGLTNLDLSSFDTSNVIDMNRMFYDMSGLTSLNLSSFDTSNVIDMSEMFYHTSNLTSLDLSNFDTSNVTDMNDMFMMMESLTDLNISNFKTSSVTNMVGMFNRVNKLTSLDVSSFDTSNVTNMGGMFYGMSSLMSLDVSNFNTSNATSMSGMFQNMSSITSLDLSGFDTSNVIHMSNMFNGMSSLTSLDVSGFDTRNVKNMYGMFANMSSLTNLDLSSFDTSNVSSFGLKNSSGSGMFYNSSNLTHVVYSELFVYNTELVNASSTVSLMYENCPANKPTHSSWEGAF